MNFPTYDLCLRNDSLSFWDPEAFEPKCGIAISSEIRPHLGGKFLETWNALRGGKTFLLPAKLAKLGDKPTKGFRKSLKLTRYPSSCLPQPYRSSKNCQEALSGKLSCLKEELSYQWSCVGCALNSGFPAL